MNLKANEIIILSYINKYSRIDLYTLQRNLNAPIDQITNSISRLYEKEYIFLGDNDKVYVSKDLPKSLIDSWDEWTLKNNNKNMVNEEYFEWDYLYFPFKFKVQYKIMHILYKIFSVKLIEDKFNYTIRLKNKMEEHRYEKSYIEGCCKYASKLLINNLPVIFDKQHIYEILKLDDIKLNSYHVFSIESKSKSRIINAPSKNIKIRQKWILSHILEKVSLPEYVHGFVKGKSIVTNARAHLNKKEILCLDIKDFFESIKFKDIVNIFYKLGYNKEVAIELSNICSINNILPQGGPASPYLANIRLKKIDDEINNVALENNLTYTRYADDITISGDFDIERFKSIIITIINRNGFEINKNKIRIMKGNQRKMVTGLIVTDILKVPKSFKKFLRQEIYYCNKYGISQHLEMRKNTISIKKVNSVWTATSSEKYDAINYREYLYGKAYFIRMVEYENGERYLKELDKIFGSEYENNK